MKNFTAKEETYTPTHQRFTAAKERSIKL